MNARALAQEGVSWYTSHLDPYATHQENVHNHLRGPLIAFTLSILQQKTSSSSNSSNSSNSTGISSRGSNAAAAAAAASATSPSPQGVTATCPPAEEKKIASDWRDYLTTTTSSTTTTKSSKSKKTNGKMHGSSKTTSTETTTITKTLEEMEKALADSGLSLRTRARLNAFLASVCLMVTAEERRPPSPSTLSTASSTKSSDDAPVSLSLIEGLAGFRNLEKKLQSNNNGNRDRNKSILQKLSSSAVPQTTGNGHHVAARSKKPMQVREPDLVTRLELYLRSLSRVKLLDQECVLAAEPARALKARAQSIVTSFIDTVGTVREQSPILTRLLTCTTMELLAVDHLSGALVDGAIRRLVSDYEHKTSFASLAFLSSPDDAAEQNLAPQVLKYLRGLQADWQNCVADCELERMLSLSLDRDMRHMFKTIEFRSIGHLLETCAGYRSQLQKIDLAPGIRGTQDLTLTLDNPDAVRQAILDLQRERITVNGHLLPPVTNRKELVHLLSQTLNSRTLSTNSAHRRGGRGKRSSKRGGGGSKSSKSGTNYSSISESELSTSANESDHPAAVVVETSKTGRTRRRNFALETIDLLTRRLLLAGSRTGTGGDAYFVVRDLFGGDDVEVVPAEIMPTHGRAVLPGTIEILVRLSNVTIKCHGSFDVYPRSMVGDCEPLIQLHTTTTETISLREVRAIDSTIGDDDDDDDIQHVQAVGVQDKYHSDTDYTNKSNGSKSESQKPPSSSVMVIQERMTDRTGWRTLAIRPALYEKVEVWNTPS